MTASSPYVDRYVGPPNRTTANNGVIDTTDLLQKITDEANARSARSAREIELLKAIYQLKYTINR